MGKVLFEVSGLPGSGKSTYVNRILKDNSYFEKEENYYIDTYGSLLKRINSLKYCFRGFGGCQDFVFLLKLICDKDVNKKVIAVKKIFKIWRFWGKFELIPKDYLLSEGFIQSYLELMDCMICADKKYIISFFIERIKLYPKLFFVIIITDYNTAYHRIDGRVGVNNSVDQMQNMERRRFLIKRERNTDHLLYAIKKYIDPNRYILIDARDSINNNVEIIQNFITDIIYNEHRKK